MKRTLQNPGTLREYNYVRVNRLALALLHVFRRPLSEILKERIMDPIGASDTWQWHGYENSWVEIDGRKCSRFRVVPIGEEGFGSAR